MINSIKQGNLPESLISSINFNELYSHRPDTRSKVLIYDKNEKIHKEKQIFRSYNCYLKTPEFDGNIQKSYMFLNKSSEIPEVFKPFLDFAKKIDPKYNQMVVNWYEPDDYIEFHRDCTAHMIDNNSPILCVNLNQSGNIYSSRQLLLKDVETDELSSLPLLNNTYYIINDNKSIRHAVSTGIEKRMSITFRMMK